MNTKTIVSVQRDMPKADWLRSEIEYVKEVQAREPESNGRYNACEEIITRYKEELKVLTG